MPTVSRCLARVTYYASRDLYEKYFHSAVLCLKENLSFSTHSHVSLNLYVASFSFFFLEHIHFERILPQLFAYKLPSSKKANKKKKNTRLVSSILNIKAFVQQYLSHICVQDLKKLCIMFSYYTITRSFLNAWNVDEL